MRNTTLHIWLIAVIAVTLQSCYSGQAAFRTEYAEEHIRFVPSGPRTEQVEVYDFAHEIERSHIPSRLMTIEMAANDQRTVIDELRKRAQRSGLNGIIVGRAHAHTAVATGRSLLEALIDGDDDGSCDSTEVNRIRLVATGFMYTDQLSYVEHSVARTTVHRQHDDSSTIFIEKPGVWLGPNTPDVLWQRLYYGSPYILRSLLGSLHDTKRRSVKTAGIDMSKELRVRSRKDKGGQLIIRIQAKRSNGAPAFKSDAQILHAANPAQSQVLLRDKQTGSEFTIMDRYDFKGKWVGSQCFQNGELIGEMHCTYFSPSDLLEQH